MKLLLLSILSVMLVACQQIDLSSYENNSQDESKVTNEEDSDDDVDNVFVRITSHVCLFTDTLANGQINAMLVSLNEWGSIASAFSGDSTVFRYTKAYQEGNLTGWRMPNRGEAKRLKDIYDDSTALDSINTILEDAGGMSLTTQTVTGKNRRYLCSNADSTYSFIKGNGILKAGKTVKYTLRLVKDTILHAPQPSIDFEY